MVEETSPKIPKKQPKGRSRSPRPRRGGRSKSPGTNVQQQGGNHPKSKLPAPRGDQSKSKSPARQGQSKSKSPVHKASQPETPARGPEACSRSNDFLVDCIMVATSSYVGQTRISSLDALLAVSSLPLEAAKTNPKKCDPATFTMGTSLIGQFPAALQCDPFFGGIAVETGLMVHAKGPDYEKEGKSATKQKGKFPTSRKGRSKSPPRKNSNSNSKSPARQKHHQKVAGPAPVAAREVEDNEETKAKQPKSTLSPAGANSREQPKKSKSPAPQQGQSASKSPNRRCRKTRSKSPKPKHTTNGKHVDAQKSREVEIFPLFARLDPLFVGLCSTGSSMTKISSFEKLAAISFAQTSKRHAPPSTLPNSITNQLAPPTYLEVEPLISQLVPEELTEAVSMKLSKSLEERENRFRNESFVSPVKGSKGQSSNDFVNASPKVDLTTPPTNLVGKVAFFERLMRQKQEEPRVDPTVKVKAAVSEKVRSVHDQVRSSLAGTKKTSTQSGWELPSNVTPLAQKRERVETFFEKEEIGMPLVKPAVKPSTAWTKKEPAPPPVFPESKKIEDDSGELMKGAPVPRVDDAIMKIEKNLDGQGDVSPANSRETNPVLAHTESDNNKASEAESKCVFPAEEKTGTGSPLRPEPCPPAPQRKESRIGQTKSKSPQRTKSRSLNRTTSKSPNRTKSKSTSRTPKPPSQPMPDAASILGFMEDEKLVQSNDRRHPAVIYDNGRKAGTELDQNQDAASSEPSYALASVLDARAKSVGVPSIQPSKLIGNEEKSAVPLPVYATTKTETTTKVDGGRKFIAGTKESPADKGDTGVQRLPNIIASNEAPVAEKSEEDAAKLQNQSPAIVISEPNVFPTRGLLSLAKAEEVAELVLELAVSAEEVHGESLSRDVAAEALEDSEDVSEPSTDFPHLVAKLPIDQFPSLKVSRNRAPKPSAENTSDKSYSSYAQALAKGERREQQRKLPSHNPAKSGGNVATFESTSISPDIDALIARVLGKPYKPKANHANKEAPANSEKPPAGEATTLAQDSHKKSPPPPGVEDVAKKVVTAARRLAEGIPQQQINSTADVSTSKAQTDFHPDNKTISKRKVDNLGKSAQHPKQVVPAAAVADGLAAPMPSSNLQKANFNPYDALVDLVEAPFGDELVAVEPTNVTIKGKRKAQKAPASPKKKRAVRFGTAALTEKRLWEATLLEQQASPPLLARPLHFVNNLAHTKPLSYIFDGIYWMLLLLVSGPLAAVGVVVIAVYGLLSFVAKMLGFGHVKPKCNPDQKLAVVVTGCDTGFGHDLAMALMEEGFVVFCCCLRKESFKAFENKELAVTILMDVTKDDDVVKASRKVIEWLSGDDGRYLHALVNNAGICVSGLVDWLPVTEFQKMMEVNFFGMVRCCKMFLPLFKFQSATGFYSDARIVNMVSMAGMTTGASFLVGYEASKHAADVFTNNLRLETRGFGLQVTAVNPSFHRTPLTMTMSENILTTWKSLPVEKRQQYGEAEYIENVCRFSEVASGALNWESRHVVSAMLKCVTAKMTPARVMVGFDAKYIFILLHILPTWVTSNIAPLRNLDSPAMLKQ